MPEQERRCQSCGVRQILRKYCQTCSPRASTLWKREARRQAKAAGERYWLEWWAKTYGEEAPLKRRQFQRQYMRVYRLRKRQEVTA